MWQFILSILYRKKSIRVKSLEKLKEHNVLCVNSEKLALFIFSVSPSNILEIIEYIAVDKGDKIDKIEDLDKVLAEWDFFRVDGFYVNLSYHLWIKREKLNMI